MPVNSAAPSPTHRYACSRKARPTRRAALAIYVEKYGMVFRRRPNWRRPTAMCHTSTVRARHDRVERSSAPPRAPPSRARQRAHERGAAASASAGAASKVTLKVARSLFGSEGTVAAARSKSRQETVPPAAAQIPFSGPPTAHRRPIPSPPPSRPHEPEPSSSEGEDEPPTAPPKPIAVAKSAVVKLAPPKPRVSERGEDQRQHRSPHPFTGIAPTAAPSHRVPARGVIPQGVGSDVVAKPPEAIARQRAEEEAAARATHKSPSTEAMTRAELELPFEEYVSGAEEEARQKKKKTSMSNRYLAANGPPATVTKRKKAKDKKRGRGMKTSQIPITSRQVICHKRKCRRAPRTRSIRPKHEAS